MNSLHPARLRPCRGNSSRSRLLRLLVGATVSVASLISGTATQAAATPASFVADHGAPGSAADWTMGGQNLADTHDAAAEHTIGPGNVARLTPKWTFTTGGSVSATPTVVHDVVYVPDWGGNLWAVNAHNGKAIWNTQISDYTGEPGDVSRLSPAYWDGELVSGDGVGTSDATTHADVFAVDAHTGAKLWTTKVDDDPYAMITSSPVVYHGIVYTGVSSRSETATDSPTFRGSVIALDARTGKLLWKTYTVPEGYTGGAVWGGTFVVDRATGLLYLGTGNNYTVPDGVCTVPDQTGCTAPASDNYIDSVLAVNLHSGAIVWNRPTLTADTWTIAKQYGPDFDFGTGPNLFTTTIGGKRVDLLGIGQKSGVYWALDPETGAIVWATAVGPGSPIGGMEWGTATDGRRIYVQIGNFDNIAYTLQGSGPYAGQTATGGSWAALDPASGKILWQTPDPQGPVIDDGMLTVANGVVYGSSFAKDGNNMYALDAATGVVKWGFASGGAVLCGPSVVHGTVYWGSGYHTEGFPPPLGYNGENDKLFAFSVPGT